MIILLCIIGFLLLAALGFVLAGLVLLEAAASGRPVIAADRAGCRETLEDGVTGFLVPVNDEQAVIAATEKILHMSDEERKAMGLRGSERIRREFDRGLVVAAYGEEIQRSLEGNL